MNHLAVSQRTLPDPPLPIDSCSCEQQDPRKGTTNFVARFRFSGQISNHATFLLPKCGFSTYSIPPNWVFRHFPMTTGVCDVARFQKRPKIGIVQHLRDIQCRLHRQAVTFAFQNPDCKTLVFTIFSCSFLLK